MHQSQEIDREEGRNTSWKESSGIWKGWLKEGRRTGQDKVVECYSIGLYRDVWIAAIASSRKSLATQTAAICVRFHGRRVRHVYVTMQITFLARKSALIYRRGLRQRVASLTIDCNGVLAIRAYTIAATPDDGKSPRRRRRCLCELTVRGLIYPLSM